MGKTVARRKVARGGALGNQCRADVYESFARYAPQIGVRTRAHSRAMFRPDADAQPYVGVRQQGELRRKFAENELIAGGSRLPQLLVYPAQAACHFRQSATAAPQSTRRTKA